MVKIFSMNLSILSQICYSIDRRIHVIEQRKKMLRSHLGFIMLTPRTRRCNIIESGTWFRSVILTNASKKTTPGPKTATFLDLDEPGSPFSSEPLYLMSLSTSRARSRVSIAAADLSLAHLVPRRRLRRSLGPARPRTALSLPKYVRNASHYLLPE